MEQVFADCVTPTHVSPLISEGVVLEEEVVLALEVDEAVGVVCPVFGGREVYLGPIRLVVFRRLGTQVESTESESGYAGHFANKRLDQGNYSPGIIHDMRL